MYHISPLGKGFLTGKIDQNTTFHKTDFRNIAPRFTPEARKANQVLVDVLAKLAAQKQATPAQHALNITSSIRVLDHVRDLVSSHILQHWLLCRLVQREKCGGLTTSHQQ